jgi:hypothetical protein
VMRCQAIQLSTHMAVVVPGMPCQADRAGIALAATTAEHVQPYRRLDAVVVHKIRLSRSNKLTPIECVPSRYLSEKQSRSTSRAYSWNGIPLCPRTHTYGTASRHPRQRQGRSSSPAVKDIRSGMGACPPHCAMS